MERVRELGTPRVRAARRDDEAAIALFQREMARETEGKELDPASVARGVQGVFEASGRGRYLVAEVGGAVVGCLLLTTEWSDWRAGTFWWIQSVYVVPEARGAGVFRALYEEVLREARATDGVAGVRLYVDAENTGAQRVYERVGMVPSHYRFYEVDFVLGETSSGE